MTSWYSHLPKKRASWLLWYLAQGALQLLIYHSVANNSIVPSPRTLIEISIWTSKFNTFQSQSWNAPVFYNLRLVEENEVKIQERYRWREKQLVILKVEIFLLVFRSLGDLTSWQWRARSEQWKRITIGSLMSHRNCTDEAWNRQWLAIIDGCKTHSKRR